MVSLAVQKRELTGKQNKKLRKQGIVPGGVSMNDGSTLMIQAGERELLPLVRSSATEIIEIEYEGKKITTIRAEIFVNPLNNKVESFALTELTPKSHVTVRVPVELTGIAPAVKNNLGTLVVNAPEIKLTVNSENIVPKLEVDISGLETTGARILVNQIPGIDKMKLASEKDRTMTVVTVRPLRQLLTEEPQAVAAAATDAAATPAEGEAAPAAEEGAEAK